MSLHDQMRRDLAELEEQQEQEQQLRDSLLQQQLHQQQQEQLPHQQQQQPPLERPLKKAVEMSHVQTAARICRISEIHFR